MVAKIFTIALEHQQAGRVIDAERMYRQVLQTEPNHADTLNNLAVLLQLQGHFEAATTHFRHALELRPDYTEAYNNLGYVLQMQGKFEEAVVSFQRALNINPALVDAHNNLGITLVKQGKLKEAEASFKRALQIAPYFAPAYYTLGHTLHMQGRIEEAIANYRKALRIKPDYAEAISNLDDALKELGRTEKAAQLKLECTEEYNNLGCIMETQGNFQEAVLLFQRALHFMPDYAIAHCNLGATLAKQGKFQEAAASFQQALYCKPDYVEAHYQLGKTLKNMGRIEEAISQYQKALQISPDSADVMLDMIHQLQHICLWEHVGDLSRRVIDYIEKDMAHEMGEESKVLSPFSVLALHLPTTLQQQYHCARIWTERIVQPAIDSASPQIVRHPPRKGSKITLGYLSADYRSHPVAYVLPELIEKHDRSRFSVIGYSYGPDDGSPIRKRLMQGFDKFVDMKNNSFAESVKQIERDGVDILIDLNGYTQFGRTEIPALRPAPIQVNYLGYPGTMGADFMDYILVDDFIVLPNQQSFFAEKLVYLPSSFHVMTSQREVAGRIPSRTECGLPEEGFVFCSFNNNYKISPDMFSVWMELLKAVPNSVLWLTKSNAYAPGNLRREAEARGVSGNRIVIAPITHIEEHLARHRLADLCLDTFPYNGHTTTIDALFMECPVLTLLGNTWASRAAGDMLRTVGLPELITTTLDEYRTLAERLAKDPELLGKLRTRLKENHKTSRLFDSDHLTRNIEKAYIRMWEHHATGAKPEPFAVNS